MNLKPKTKSKPAFQSSKPVTQQPSQKLKKQIFEEQKISLPTQGITKKSVALNQVKSRYKIQKTVKNSSSEKISKYLIEEIFLFCANSLDNYHSIQLTCPRFYRIINSSEKFWILLAKQYLKSGNLITTQVPEIRLMVIKNYVTVQNQKLKIFYDNIFKLFQYQIMKGNTTLKQLQSLQTEISLVVNEEKEFKNLKVITINSNPSAHLSFKLTDLNQFKLKNTSLNFKKLPSILFEIKVYSKLLKCSINLKRDLIIGDILQKCVKQKAFNYITLPNCLFCMFDGDDKILYLVFSISATEVLNGFRMKLMEKQKNYKIQTKNSNYFFKYLSPYDSLTEYLRNQIDFNLNFHIHDGMNIFFSYANSKCFPVQDSKNQATWRLQIDQQFNPKKLKFVFNDQLGITEAIDNLFILDLCLKDQDQFLIVFSGYVFLEKRELNGRIAKSDNYQMKVLTVEVTEGVPIPYCINIIIKIEFGKEIIEAIEISIYA